MEDKKIDPAEMQIASSKILADGEAYFKLFEKHVPRDLGAGADVMLYKIGNMTCMLELIALNPAASYVIVGNEAASNALKVMLPETTKVKYFREFDFKETDMKFDCIVMNPPYQRNLHLKILAEAIKHLKDEKSVCVNLSPVGWLTDPVAKLKKNSKYNSFEEDVSKHIKSLDILEAKAMSETFSIGLWTGLGIYVCEKSSGNTLYESAAKNEKGNCWSLIEKIGIPLFTKTIPNVCSVFDSFSKNKSLPYWIKCSRVHGHPGCKDEFDCITPKIELVLNKKGNEGKEVYFSTKEEAINFFKILNLRFFKFVKYLGCYAKDDFNKGLPFLGDTINPRTGLKGYQGEWTDDDLYKFFNITPDEQKVIEETMAKYDPK